LATVANRSAGAPLPARDTAPKAAGLFKVILSENVSRRKTGVQDLIDRGSVASARENGLHRIKGKEYVVEEVEVLHFKFNVKCENS
jgi:ribosome-binding ATPase YchF (GTP1/OBG family)